MASKKAKAPAAEQVEVAPQAAVVVAYKGFDRDWKCRDFQYEAGKTYEHTGDVAACSSGFHACENPLDVFGYYAPGQARFALVEVSGELSRHADDSKIAAAKITIKAELTIPEIVSKTIAFVSAVCKAADSEHATGYSSASSATGDSSASSATGDSSASSATGYSSASSATGGRSASSATGDSSASSATGIAAVALNTGRCGKSCASAGGAIVICNHDDEGNLRHIFSSKVGENGIEPDVFYTLDDDGIPRKAA